MDIGRRELFTGAAVAAGAATLAACTNREAGLGAWDRLRAGGRDWDDFRALFPLTAEWTDMSAMLVTSHPWPVADAIAKHRAGLDENPVIYLTANNRPQQNGARDAAGAYLGVPGTQVALTDSTTMGVSLVYRGLRLKPGDEVLTTEHDYYVTHEALRLSAERSGATVRRVKLHDTPLPADVSADALVDALIREVRPNTRVLAVTFVHSSTGLRLPVEAIGKRVAEINARRGDDDRLIYCVDSVHGFGNQVMSLPAFNADFVMAGCHKWLFGPRGTGIVAGSEAGWKMVDPVIPTFLDSDAYGRWKRNDPAPETDGAIFSPGGFKAFEHLWALNEAFALHALFGQQRIRDRTAELASALKDGLAAMPGVNLITPRDPALSAGIVSFEFPGKNPWEAVEALREKKLIASVAPYRTPYVRLTPSVRNSMAEIETALTSVRAVAA
jgi:selenocysteine lyase/cysteine desulfurase